MRRKIHNKGATDAKAPITKPVTESKARDRKEDEGRPDFGGLPDRDLKKNLGCA